MVEKQKIINDALQALLEISDYNIWKAHEQRDDIMRRLKFIASSLRNVHNDNTLLNKAIDAFAAGYTDVAYTTLFSNNKLNSQAEQIYDAKHKNSECNFAGRLLLQINNNKRTV